MYSDLGGEIEVRIKVSIIGYEVNNCSDVIQEIGKTNTQWLSYIPICQCLTGGQLIK